MRTSPQLLAVAAELMAAPDDVHWGYSLSKATGVRSGVLYPMLQRLLDAGWLRDGWEEAADAAQRRTPPRRYYVLTELGRIELGAVALRPSEPRIREKRVQPTPRVV